MAIKLTWYDNNAIEDGYRVYRSLSPIDPLNLPSPLTELSSDAQEYTDNTTQIDTTYYYRISAIRNSNEVVGDQIEIAADGWVEGGAPTNIRASYYSGIPIIVPDTLRIVYVSDIPF